MKKLMPRYPIFIPSKGRADNFMTGRALSKFGIPYYAVVEPSQVDAYAKVVPKKQILVLPENDRGLVYSRNWITDYAKQLGDERHWQIDDDITEFYHLTRGYRFRCDARVAIAMSEEFADRYTNVALLALNSYFFLPQSRGSSRVAFPPFYLNHRCYTCILFLNALPNRWRPPNNEDADMTLQVLADGWCTILMNVFSMNTPTTMKVKGGQTAGFKAGARLRMVRALEKRWPGVVRVGRRFGHPQHFIKGEWKYFDNKLQLKPGLSHRKLSQRKHGLTFKVLAPIKSTRLKKVVETTKL